MSSLKKLVEILRILKNGVVVYTVIVNEQTLCFDDLEKAINFISDYRNKFNLITKLSVVKQILLPCNYE